MRRLVVEPSPSRAAFWSRRLALFALTVLAFGLALGQSARLDVPGTIGVVGSGFLLAIAAIGLAILAFVTIWRSGRSGLGRALFALMLSFGLLAWPAWLSLAAFRLPAINDVTTDLADPPAFSRSRAALAARSGHVPPPSAPETRAAQARAYPSIAPISLDIGVDAAFALVGKAAARRGFEVIDAVAPGGRTGAGRIDAISRTALLRFPDDVTIRVRPLAAGTRIDLRSVSRYGRFDFGANARRIRDFAAELTALADAQE